MNYRPMPAKLLRRVLDHQRWLSTGGRVGNRLASRTVYLDFSGMDLRGLDFSFAVLRDAEFVEADLRHALFFRTELNGATFYKANLKDATFQESNLTTATFIGSNFDEARYRSNLVSRVRWTDDGPVVANPQSGLSIRDVFADPARLPRKTQNPSQHPDPMQQAAPDWSVWLQIKRSWEYEPQ